MKRVVAVLIAMALSSAAFAAAEPEIIWAGGAWRLANESAPAYMAETFVSLGQADNLYVFSDPTAFIKESELGVDLGLGVRMPVLGGRAVAGYNLYFDYTTDNYHKRVGTGAEFFHPYFSAHLNVYLPVSDDHGGEEALPGVDLSLGIPVPNAPYIIVRPGLYFYSGRDEDDFSGMSLALEVKPVKAVSVIVGGRNDALESGRDDSEVFAELRVTIPMRRLGEDLFKFDKGVYPADVNAMMDRRVIREPFITVEHKKR